MINDEQYVFSLVTIFEEIVEGCIFYCIVDNKTLSSFCNHKRTSLLSSSIDSKANDL